MFVKRASNLKNISQNILLNNFIDFIYLYNINNKMFVTLFFNLYEVRRSQIKNCILFTFKWNNSSKSYVCVIKVTKNKVRLLCCNNFDRAYSFFCQHS